MHFVVISKPPEFTPNGEVVPGQCEPYTGGWRLLLVEDGRVEEVLVGMYSEIRRVQRDCLGKAPDEVRKVAAEAAEGVEAAAPPLPPLEDESTQILDVKDVRRAMLEMEDEEGSAAAAAAVRSAPAKDSAWMEAEWVELSERDGVAIASVKPDGGSVDVEELACALGAALQEASGGLVVDLGGFSPPEKGTAKVLVRTLVDLLERARPGGRFLGLVGASDQLKEAVDGAEGGPAVLLFPDVETALAAAVRQVGTPPSGPDVPARRDAAPASSADESAAGRDAPPPDAGSDPPVESP